MSRPHRPAPIGPFLGDAAASGGPFALLGLEHHRAAPEDVAVALERQLQRVDSHPHGDTPEGDDVRLALHAAAAQLLDPAVRERMAERWRVGDAMGVDLATAPRSWDPEPSAPARAESPSFPLRAPAVAGSGGVTAARLRDEEPETSASGVGRTLMLVGGVVGAMLLVFIVGLVLLTSAKPSPRPVPAPSVDLAADLEALPGIEAATPSGGATLPTSPPVLPAAPPQATVAFADVRAVTRALRQSAADAKAKPEAGAATFEAAAAWLAAQWPVLGVAERRAANDAAVEYIYAALVTPGGAGVKALSTVSAGLSRLSAAGSRLTEADVWPAAWSAGMMTRLNRGTELPRAAAGRVDKTLDEGLGPERRQQDQTFEAGAMASLRRMPLRLVAGAPAGVAGEGAAPSAVAPLARWVAAAKAATGGGPALERVLADALGQIMILGPEADGDKGVFEAIGSLAAEIKWRGGGIARDRLLEWFRDPKVSTGDLSVLTSAIAGASGAEGVTPSMVLKWGAVPTEREELRLAYAKAWGGDAGGTEGPGGSVPDEWGRAISALAYHPPAHAGPAGDLLDALRFARANDAARRIWAGDRDGASSAIRLLSADLDATAPEAPRVGRPVAMPEGSGDGRWAVEFLGAGRSIPLRHARLKELDAQGGSPIGPVDAGVLAETACLGSPADVRSAAQKIVEKFAQEPAMVNAVLDVLPRAPKIESVAVTIARVANHDLPGVGDPAWTLAARRALVERLIELMAAGGDVSGLDRAAGELTKVYASGATEGASAAPAQGAAPDAASGAALLWDQWRAEASKYIPNEQSAMPLDQIERRRAGRLSLATGPVQRFAAEQASLAEVMAYVVSGERTGRSASVGAIMADLTAQRRAARSVFEQMLATERCMTRLWAVRLGEEASWPAS